MNANFRSQLIDLLLHQVDLGTDPKRSAFVFTAALDRNLINDLNLSQPQSVFVCHLVESAIKHNPMTDGRDPIEEILSAVKSGAGRETAALCDRLLSMWQMLKSDDSHKFLVQEPIAPSTVPPQKILRNCLEQGFDMESILVFCQTYFEYVHKRHQPWMGLDRIISAILDYSQQHGKIEYLWTCIKIERPHLYKEFYSLWSHGK